MPFQFDMLVFLFGLSVWWSNDQSYTGERKEWYIPTLTQSVTYHEKKETYSYLPDELRNHFL